MSSSQQPPSAQLESALRHEVTRLFKDHDMDNLTLKRVRAVVEEELELEPGWFKQHDEWNQKSKDIVTNEVTLCENLDSGAAAGDENTSPVKHRKPSAVANTAQKRKSPSLSPQPQKKQRRGEAHPQAESATKQNTDDESSSLSEVLDPSPPPKQKRGKPSKDKAVKATSSKAGPSSSKSTKQAKSRGNNLTSEDAQIKTLQSWLVKCGLRKLWGKELSRFDSPAEKIGHLKEMLEDVGMGGRYSEEKAKKIKEARELAADLQDIQQAEKHWGTSADDTRRPARRRLSRAPIAAPSESSSPSEVDETHVSDPANNVSDGSDVDD